MKSTKAGFSSIDEYIARFPADIGQKLETVRAVIKAAAPQAQETISYQMPAFALNGVLVYFAAFKSHIGFYPTSSGIQAFQKEISTYKNSKGAVQFPMDEPLPVDLISRMVKYRVSENLKRAEQKSRKAK
jgi:uncharacterized protein YdhG (YjbR/CyaY superfamily)